MFKKQRTIFTHVLIYASFFLLSKIASAQVLNFDYLTYSDYASGNHLEFPKGKLTSFIFFAENAFDASGNASGGDISYREIYAYTAYRIYNKKRVQINLAAQFGILLSEVTTSSLWGTPWVWGKYRITEKLPLFLRLGFEWGKLGNAFWIEDNDLDLALISNKSLRFAIIDATLSYRIRWKSRHDFSEGAGFYNQAGNEIHYKLEASKKLSSKTFLSLLVLGYRSDDKKLDGVTLPNSYSRKTTIGATCVLKTKKSRFFVLGLMYDLAGRLDRKGISFVFNVTD